MVGVLASGLGLGDTVVGLVGVLIGLLHLGRCLGAGIVVGLSESGIVVVGGNVVVKLWVVRLMSWSAVMLL